MDTGMQEAGDRAGVPHDPLLRGAAPSSVRLGELDAVYLLPEAQGLGVGRLLVEDALAGLAETGYAECLLWVVDQNTHARGFYQHLGFRYDGGRDVWRGLPVVSYRRKLSATPA